MVGEKVGAVSSAGQGDAHRIRFGMGRRERCRHRPAGAGVVAAVSSSAPMGLCCFRMAVLHGGI